MLTILRTWLVALLLAAVPFQGYAQASMVGCGSTHGEFQPAVESSAHEHGAAGHAGMHGHETHSGHDHHTAGHTDGKSGTDPTSGCGSCAPCCVGAAMATALVTVPVSHDFIVLPGEPLLKPASAEPHRLDRPPRTSLL